MKKNKLMFILTLTVIFLFEGCISFRTCPDNIVGRYFSVKKAKNIINFININKDGTYYHYYKEGTIEVNCSGKWKKIDNSNCEISLSNYKNFNVKGLDYEYFKGTIFFINNQYLDMTPDGDDLDSFKKEKISNKN